MTDLLTQIVTQSLKNHEPKWLTEKRKLAFLLMEQLPANKDNESTMNRLHNQATALIQTIRPRTQATVDDGNQLVNMDLLTAAQQFPELLQENLMEKAISWQDSQLNALHLALMTGGRFIYVPDDWHGKAPIVINLNAQQNEHALVIVGANAQVDLIEQVVGEKSAMNYLGTELLLGANSQVNYYQANQLAGQVNHQEVKVYQAKESQLQIYAAMFEEVDCQSVINVELNGFGSSATVNMVAMANQQQTQTIETHINNVAPKTVGQINQHGVAKDASQLTFHATGKIIHGAHQANSQQTSRILTLSDTCHGEADPVLLIDENDVNAGHAASIGKVDEEQLYYLQTRGITKQQAQFLLTSGFLEPVLHQFPSEALKQQVTSIMKRRLKVG